MMTDTADWEVTERGPGAAEPMRAERRAPPGVPCDAMEVLCRVLWARAIQACVVRRNAPSGIGVCGEVPVGRLKARVRDCAVNKDESEKQWRAEERSEASRHRLVHSLCSLSLCAVRSLADSRSKPTFVGPL